MARQKVKFDLAKLQILADLREAVELPYTQKMAAIFFSKQDPGTVGDWECGRAKPHPSNRGRFILYLWDELRLRRDPIKFEEVWKVLVEEWQWEPLTIEEKIQQGLILAMPPTAYSAPFAQPPKPAIPPVLPNFIGRAEELAHYQQKLEVEGSVVIAGPPGVGKTSLAAELSRRVAGAERIFWYTSGDEDGLKNFIWKLAGWLYYRDRDSIWRLLQSESQPRHRLLDNLSRPDRDLLDHLFEQLKGTGYILCIDDIHLLNGSKPLRQKLFNAAHAKDIRFILSGRQIFDLDWSLEIEPLAGLNREDTETLLRTQVFDLDEASLNEIHRLTEGNPQLLMLTLRVLHNTTDIRRLIGRLADAKLVEDFLLAEVDNTLDDKARLAMKGVAMLLGSPGTEEVIENILDGVSVHRELLQLSKQYLLQTTNSDDRATYVQHKMIQEYYYRQLGKRERQAMHERAATYYETHYDDFHAGLHLVYAGADMRAVPYAVKDVRVRLIHGQGHHLQAMLNKINVNNLTKAEQAQIALAKGQVELFFRNTQLAKTHLNHAYELFLSLDDSTEVRLDQVRTCRELGFLLKSTAPSDAVTWLQQGLSIVGETAEQKADLYIQLADAYGNLGNMQAVRDALERALALLPNEARWLRLLALIGLGKHYYFQNKLDLSREHMLHALAMADSSNDPFNQLAIRINLAALNQITGKWQDAIRYYRAAQELATNYGYIREKVRIYLNSGVLQAQLGETRKARELLAKALGAAQIGEIRDDWIASLGYLADLALTMNDQQTAHNYIYEAEQLLETSQQNFLRPFIIYVRAKYLLHKATYVGITQLSAGAAPAESDLQRNLRKSYSEQAMIRAQDSAKIAKDLGMGQEEGLALRLIGQAYAGQNNLEHALENFAKSVTLLASNSYEIAQTKMVWGECLLNYNQVEKGLALLREARLIFNDLNAKIALQDVDHLLAQYH